MSAADTGKPERAPYLPPTFRRLDVEESNSGEFAGLEEGGTLHFVMSSILPGVHPAS
jgi:hypothetical protein